MKKKIGPLLLALLLLLCALPAAAADSGGTAPAFVVSTVQAGAGEPVDVTVSICNNPGIQNARLYVHYDSSVLTLENVTDGGLLRANMHSDDYELDPYVLLWYQMGADATVTDDGVLATLSFRVNPFAEAGTTAVTVSYGRNDVTDGDMHRLTPDCVDGGVTVASRWNAKKTSYTMRLPGDVTVMAAGYSEGRMQYCKILQTAGSSSALTRRVFQKPDTPVDEIKVLFLNGDFTPQREAWVIYDGNAIG